MPLSTLKNPNRTLRLLLLIHLVITATCVILVGLFCPSQWFFSLGLGSIYSWIALLTTSFGVYLFFLKKNIALLISVIVFKWPILIYVTYKMTEGISLIPECLISGFSTLLLSSLIWSILQKE